MQKTPYKIEKPEDLTRCCVDIDEQEISITLGRQDTKLSIYVNDNTWVTKIKRLWEQNLTGWECYATKDRDGKITGYFFETSRKAFGLRTGKGKKVDFSEETIERRRKHAQHLQELRKAKRAAKNNND